MPSIPWRLAGAATLLLVTSACNPAASTVTPTPVVIVVTATSAPATATAPGIAAAPSPTIADKTPTATPPPPPPTAPPAATTAALPLSPTARPRAPTPTPTLPVVWTPFVVEGNNIDRFVVSLANPNSAPARVQSLTLRQAARIKPGTRDGDGIQDVQFEITEDASGEFVYRHVERNVPYCAFQEQSGTTCRTIPVRAGLRWPNSDNNEILNRAVRSGPHSLQVTVNGKNGELWQGTFPFTIP